MTSTTYNKSASRQGSFVHEQVIAPARGAACSNMNWHDYFTYDVETGSLIWKERAAEAFLTARSCNIWNARFAGAVAGCRVTRASGRPWTMAVSVRSKSYYIHRIIWEMHNGPIPEGLMIDHINGDPWDNRLCNLRLATRSENGHNRGANKNNTSGMKGVSPHVSGSFMAQIRVNGRRIYLGCFPTPEAAHAAYCEAAKIHHGNFARTS